MDDKIKDEIEAEVVELVNKCLICYKGVTFVDVKKNIIDSLG